MQLKGRPLTYFGLPGPAIADLLDWQDLPGKRTGVERLAGRGDRHRDDLERHRRLLRNVLANGISDGFQLLRGDIEDVILNGTDKDGTAPQLNNGGTDRDSRFHYDVVNLDFFGGVGYRDRRGEAKRVRAQKKLFERQQGTSFLLLLTVSVRDGLGDELTDYLSETRARVTDPLRDVVDWYMAQERGAKDLKLKAVLPLFLQRVAEDNMFSCHAYPPVIYDGTGGTRMVHCTLSFTHVAGNLQAFSTQSVADLLSLPPIFVENGRLGISGRRPSRLERTACEVVLTFLPEETRMEILERFAMEDVERR